MNVTVLDDYTSPPTTTNDLLRASGKANRVHRLVGHPPCRDTNASVSSLPLCTRYEASREGRNPSHALPHRQCWRRPAPRPGSES
jgi:hypothetical protein